MKTLKLKKVILVVAMFLLTVVLIIVGQSRQEEISNLAKQRYLDNNNQTKLHGEI